MVRLTNHHQGAYCRALLKLCLLKQSANIRRYEFSAVVWLHNYPVLMVCVCAVHSAQLDSFCTAHSTHNNRLG